ncbi:hypothetical protein [Massilia sp. BSC265]|uniref:hypothetical protein n=1 Tax=Massilia sp. BSC265 TaxID=1549812 RepID=UPI0004E89635|nr:hypothetical protein [Massilia sp. BSC265]KFI09025.1 hypothetical protein JN27_00780 [Massilia sp. BSC265]
MRTKLLLAAAATFFTLTANAAPHGTASERVDVIGAQPKQTQMAPFMFDKVQGEYRLDDGRILTVTGKLDGQARKLYANLGDGATEIVHVGKNRFVAMGKDLRLSFDRPDGRRVVDTVRVSSLDGRSIALAQR